MTIISRLLRFIGRRWMVRMTFAAIILSILAGPALAVHAVGRLSSQDDARRIGLQRAWFAQVQLDRSRNQVERAVLIGDRLTVLTSAGLLQEFNALTGQTLWTARVGNPNHPSLGPAGNERYVALLNGSKLFVLDRVDGKPIKVRAVGGAPGAAPAISEKHVFVPLVTGRMEAYPLDEQVLTPWYYQSRGRAMVAPIATQASFAWGTDSGNFYVGQSPDLGVRFRLETGSQIAAPPGYGRPYLYVASMDGEVFALHEQTGARRWKYATGYPVLRAPAVVDERIYVTTDEPALHCIDGSRGVSHWEALDVTQFAAQSRDRVYGVDHLGRIVVLDSQSGALVGRIPTDIATHALVNDQTDRIYLVSLDGLVQCLHEIDSAEPLYHQPTTVSTEASAEAPVASPTETTPPQQPADEDETPSFGEEEPPAGESQFGTDEDNPFDF